MRIAILSFHLSWNDAGGLLTNGVWLPKLLREVGHEADLFRVSVSGRPTKKLATPVSGELSLKTADFSFLNKYDLVIFVSPGFMKRDDVTSHYERMLSSFTTPYMLLFIGERDGRVYPDMKLFYAEHKAAGVIANTDLFKPVFPFREFVPDENWFILPLMIDPSFLIPNRRSLIQAQLNRKVPRSVACLSRWTPLKRIMELADVATNLGEYDFVSYGSRPIWSYLHDIKEKYPHVDEMLGWKGTLEGNNLAPSNVLHDQKFAWCATGWKKGYTAKRVENVTAEAIANGAVPIVTDEFSPDWLDEECCIRVPFADLAHAVTDVLPLYEEIHEKIALRAFDRMYEHCGLPVVRRTMESIAARVLAI